MTISFIGTGNMGGALARAAVRAGDPQNVALADYSAEKAKTLADELGCRFAADNAAAVRASNYILLAVKPQVMKGVLEGIVPVLAECVKNGERKVLVTIAAGLPMSFYREVLGEISIPLIRLMPNTPAAVGQGMTLLTSDGASEDDIAGLERYLREAGAVSRIPENLLDAAGCVTGCAPAFTCLFLEGLADGAVMAGVPRAQALEYAARTVMGTAALLLATASTRGSSRMRSARRAVRPSRACTPWRKAALEPLRWTPFSPQWKRRWRCAQANERTAGDSPACPRI